jgi:DNA-binding XRE family transcriptional regulator
MFGGFSKTGGVNVNAGKTLTQLKKELDTMENRNLAYGIEPGEMIETRIIAHDGEATVLQRVTVKDIPPAETCNGKMPLRLEHAVVPPVVMEGAYVRWLRRMAGIKNDEIASLMGVATSTISNWENGVTRVPADDWESLVDLLTVR